MKIWILMVILMEIMAILLRIPTTIRMNTTMMPTDLTTMMTIGVNLLTTTHKKTTGTTMTTTVIGTIDTMKTTATGTNMAMKTTTMIIGLPKVGNLLHRNIVPHTEPNNVDGNPEAAVFLNLQCISPSHLFNYSTVIETTATHKGKRTSIESSSHIVSSLNLETVYVPISPFLIVVLCWKLPKVARVRGLVLKVQVRKFLQQSLLQCIFPSHHF
jgi:hypothetical protein